MATITEKQKSEIRKKAGELKSDVQKFLDVKNNWAVYVKKYDPKELEEIFKNDEVLNKLGEEINTLIEELDLG